MKRDKIITRRKFFKTAGAGATASLISTPVLLNAARAKAQEEWRMAVVWSDPPPELELFTQMVSEGTDGGLKIKIVSAGEIGPLLETIEAVGKGAWFTWLLGGKGTGYDVFSIGSFRPYCAGTKCLV